MKEREIKILYLYPDVRAREQILEVHARKKKY